jgi:hypothetical protein
MWDEVSVWENEGGFNREIENHGSKELKKLLKTFEKMTPEEYRILHQKACELEKEDPSPKII